MTKGNRSLNLFFSKNIFLGSFYLVNKMPSSLLPECCFMGRSNVGKSSIINAITKSRKLAKISKTPGRTQSINLFKISNRVHLVDLPGYGYAKLSLIVREKLSKLTKSYLAKRNNLQKIYILIDCNIGFKETDIDAFDLVSETNNIFAVILTKTDKCSKNFVVEQKKSISSLLENYPTTFSGIFATSSKNNEGIIDIQKDIYNLTNLV